MFVQIIASSNIRKIRILLARHHDKVILSKPSKAGLAVPRVLLRAEVINLGQITLIVVDTLLVGVAVDRDQTFQTAATFLQAVAGITQDFGPEEAAITRKTISLTHESTHLTTVTYGVALC